MIEGTTLLSICLKQQEIDEKRQKKSKNRNNKLTEKTEM